MRAKILLAITLLALARRLIKAVLETLKYISCIVFVCLLI